MTQSCAPENLKEQRANHDSPNANGGKTSHKPRPGAAVFLAATPLLVASLALPTVSCSPSRESVPAANALATADAYLGLTPPGTVPEVFAPGLVSLTDEYEYGSAFSPDGTEFFYGVELGLRTEIRRMHFSIDSGWNGPELFLGDETQSTNDPAFSPDGAQAYYIRRGLTKDLEKEHADLFVMERTVDGWGAGRKVEGSVNTEANEFYFSSTTNGEVYFASNSAATQEPQRNYDLYQATWSNGQLMREQRLPEGINTRYYEADPFVARDGSYLIFASVRPGGLGRGDLYVSFPDTKNIWSAPQPLAVANTEGHELCPIVSPDGQFLFYTSREDIYWVAASVIEDLRPRQDSSGS